MEVWELLKIILADHCELALKGVDQIPVLKYRYQLTICRSIFLLKGITQSPWNLCLTYLTGEDKA